MTGTRSKLLPRSTLHVQKKTSNLFLKPRSVHIKARKVFAWGARICRKGAKSSKAYWVLLRDVRTIRIKRATDKKEVELAINWGEFKRRVKEIG